MKKIFILAIIGTFLIFLITMSSYAAFLDFANGMFDHWTVYFFAIYFVVFDISVVLSLLTYVFTKDTNKKDTALRIVGKAICVTIALLLLYAFIAPKRTVSNRIYRPCLVKLIPINYHINRLQKSPDYCPLQFTP